VVVAPLEAVSNKLPESKTTAQTWQEYEYLSGLARRVILVESKASRLKYIELDAHCYWPDSRKSFPH